MSSVQVDRATKLDKPNRKENEKSRKPFPPHKKHKHDDNRHHKFSRKRLQSYNVNGKCPPAKRWKKEFGCKKDIVLPTKFLLGGSIYDPLNLNSLQDEEVNRALNAVTPKSSPLPTPKHRKGTIEVIIPPNICDPLNLSNCNDDEEYEKQLISPTKKSSKKRNRKKKRALSFSSATNKVSEDSETKDEEVVVENKDADSGKAEVVPQVPEKCSSPSKEPEKEAKVESQAKDKGKLRLKVFEEPKDKRLRKVDVKDRIVSPVIPQPGAWKTRFLHRPSQDNNKKKPPQQMPKFKPKDAQFQYGNYNRYYGYRNLHQEVDTRLKVFAQRKELFCEKDILDIGCNIGHITLSVGRDFSPRSVTGIDIDRNLIKIARKNIKHYVNCAQSPAAKDGGANTKDHDANFFPISMPINYGPIDVPGFMKDKSHKGFPYNVTFVQGNYVLDDDALLSLEQPQFDVVLCLSTTKWVHLNFGDEGLKQSFKRMFAQLRPGGVLVLEAQNWNSYGKKKTRTERIFKNYQSIKFFPNQFTQYLLSPEVGFSKCEVISNPPHPSKGFQRPLHLFTKAAPVEESPVYVPAAATANRFEHREQATKESDDQYYLRGLFPSDPHNPACSQRSLESLMQCEFDSAYSPYKTPVYHYDTSGPTSYGAELSPISLSPSYEAEVSETVQPISNHPSEETAAVEKMEEEETIISESPSNDT